jgi:hypothetical protein
MYGVEVMEAEQNIATLYLPTKMHKTPPSYRCVTAAHKCFTRAVSRVLTACLRAVSCVHRDISKSHARDKGIPTMWVVDNTKDIHAAIHSINEGRRAKTIHTFDFSTLYTNITHSSLYREMKTVIEKAFAFQKKKYLKIFGKDKAMRATWVDKKLHGKTFTADQLCGLLKALLENLYAKVGEKIFRQVIGIPMGTDCAPFLANLYLYSLESRWIEGQVKVKNWKILSQFQNNFRFIDDLLALNNTQMGKIWKDIYPSELILKLENEKETKQHSWTWTYRSLMNESSPHSMTNATISDSRSTHSHICIATSRFIKNTTSS